MDVPWSILLCSHGRKLTTQPSPLHHLSQITAKVKKANKYHSGKDRDLGPPVKRFPNFKSFDNLTIDSELNDDQLFLCSYYVFGYVFSVRECGFEFNHPVSTLSNTNSIQSFLTLRRFRSVRTTQIWWTSWLSAWTTRTWSKQVRRRKILNNVGFLTDESHKVCHDYAIDHKDWSADIIPGKGEGQIFLLHGRPGVGKTLTAGA